ncbi:MAG: ATP-binding cassette domain-containing protein [Clostridia bacterium]|nr:ATP-binding cassette domain-containing protein [Clostridia bacterium]
MNAIEIKGLSKNFGAKQAVCALDMTVPMGAIYGFIGENGSGKSTTEKMICGLIPKSGGSIKIYGRDHTDKDVRAKMGVLIEAPGCFGGLSVFDNMMLQATNLSIPNAEREVIKTLKMVRMEGAAGNKYKNCSLGMKQRVGIAMALLGDPTLLVLDEPLNGLDADGMRIMREIFLDIVRDGRRTILVSSHLLGELQKVATHYGIIRHGKMICEMTAEQLDADCRTYVALQSAEMSRTKALLGCKYARVEEDEAGYLRVYDQTTPEEVVTYLYKEGIPVTEIKTDKIGLEEYYIDLMKGGNS